MQILIESIIKILVYLLPLGALLLPLAMPVTIWWRPRPRFFRAVILAIGLIVPFIIFLLSTLAQDAEWKGDCPHGWLDCFLVGKLWLTPLVLWASSAWWGFELRRTPGNPPTPPWIVLGLFHGAVVSFVCLLSGILTLGSRGGRQTIWLLVPFLVAASYSTRTWQLIRTSSLAFTTYVGSFVLAAPVWIASVIWSKQIYAALPDQRPDGCFVVTAAARGHPALVGPFFETSHRGRRRPANRQLVTFWEFEELWRRRAPVSHAAFRKLYGRAGPVIARRITRRWVADLVYLALKPAELLAALATRTRRNYPA